MIVYFMYYPKLSCEYHSAYMIFIGKYGNMNFRIKIAHYPTLPCEYHISTMIFTGKFGNINFRIKIAFFTCFLNFLEVFLLGFKTF